MTHAPRRVDHLVVAVHDLDAAAALYQRLGFHVGARNRHPWGTENRLIQFSGSFVELITLGAGADAGVGRMADGFSFGGFVRDYLRVRQGPAMLALDSDDARADAARFHREGLGSLEPLFFERSGRRPDGSETRVAFTLAFAVDPRAPAAGFFVCQHHFPENFWSPALQRHENGASGIAAIGMAAAVPEQHADFLAAFSGSVAQRHPDGSLSVELLGSRLLVVPDPRDGGDLRFRSVTIRIADPVAHARHLTEAGIPFVASGDGLSVGAEAAMGLVIQFQRSAMP